MIHNSQNWIYGGCRVFGKEHTEVRSHLMSWKHTDFTTTLTHLRTERDWEGFLSTSPAYLPKRDTRETTLG